MTVCHRIAKCVDETRPTSLDEKLMDERMRNCILQKYLTNMLSKQNFTFTYTEHRYIGLRGQCHKVCNVSDS